MTKEKWTNLPPKGQWDIQVALRGPDIVHSQLIKWFSTSVVRGQMEGIMRVGGLVNRNLPFIVVPADYRVEDPSTYLVKPTTFDSRHFFEHIITACAWMDIEVVRIEGKTYRGGLEHSGWGSVKKCFKFWRATLLEKGVKEEVLQAHEEFLLSNGGYL